MSVCFERSFHNFLPHVQSGLFKRLKNSQEHTSYNCHFHMWITKSPSGEISKTNIKVFDTVRADIGIGPLLIHSWGPFRRFSQTAFIPLDCGMQKFCILRSKNHSCNSFLTLMFFSLSNPVFLLVFVMLLLCPNVFISFP